MSFPLFEMLDYKEQDLSFPQFLDRFYPEIRWFSIALSEWILSGEASPARLPVRCPAWAEACHYISP